MRLPFNAISGLKRKRKKKEVTTSFLLESPSLHQNVGDVSFGWSGVLSFY